MAKRRAKKPAKPVVPPLRTSVSDKIERGLVKSALAKHKAGKTPTCEERAALRRWEKASEERERWEHYRTIPQKDWRAMSGRQTKILHDQASTYGLPFGGPTINLPDVVRALHDFLAANARKLSKGNDGDDSLLVGPDSPALERYRDERAKLARLDRLEREQVLVRRDEVHDWMNRLASLLRSAGESLQRQFGDDAMAVLDETLDDFERELKASKAKDGCEHD